MMERVAFLVEESGERISALLNPPSVTVRRAAGLRVLDDRPGSITGLGGTDDGLLATAGGRTEIELDLLFDVSLVPTSRPRPDPADPAGQQPPPTSPQDVRLLTRPIWALAENGPDATGPPAVWFCWGKAWMVPAVVQAVAERLERFSAAGVPERSLLRLRLLRTAEDDSAIGTDPGPPPPPVSPAALTPRAPAPGSAGTIQHRVTGDGERGERLDQIAAAHLGDARWWRHLAVVNDVTDPPWVAPGTVLAIPPARVLRELSSASVAAAAALHGDAAAAALHGDAAAAALHGDAAAAALHGDAAAAALHGDAAVPRQPGEGGAP